MNFTQKRTLTQIEKQKQRVLDESDELSLTKLLSTERCQTLISESREYRERLYSPLTTLFMFIKQVLSTDKSCKKAVSGRIAEQIKQGVAVSSSNTGPYCKARERLPEVMIKELVKEVGQSASQKAAKGWKVYGREIKLVDGSTLLMSDTAANQEEYPQHGNQKEGVGFPLARLVVVMSLTVGTIVDYAIEAFKGKGTGEQTLLRRIFSCINPDDILMGDRYYPSFF
jgi:hypothetical protein